MVSKAWRYEEIPQIVEVLHKHFKPESVIDFGCANGLHLKAFQDLEVEGFGIEGSGFFMQHIEKNFGNNFKIWDLREKLNLRRKYDLAICIEVLEHIERLFADVVVQSIRNHADVLCISASSTSTARYHVNAQDKAYWIEKFENSREFEHKDLETDALQKKFSLLDLRSNWMAENLMIFRRHS